jgi:uncharacterized protein (DUF1501 family)
MVSDEVGPVTTDRRGFLRAATATASLAALAAGGAGGTFGISRWAARFAFADAAVDRAGDVLVVVTLRGGADGLAAVAPAGDPGYPEFLAGRPTTGVPADRVRPLDDRFGLHPALEPLLPFWRTGTLAAVHAVGLSAAQKSHVLATRELERGTAGGTAADNPVTTRWLDRALALRPGGGALRAVRTGPALTVPADTAPGATLPVGAVDDLRLVVTPGGTPLAGWDAALRAMYRDAPAPLAAPASAALDGLAAAGGLAATPYQVTGGAEYPSTAFGTALRDVARLIKAEVGLQVATLDHGGWDLHADAGGAGPGGRTFDLLSELGRGLAAFGTDLGARLGAVTLLTTSEFGRMAAENGSRGVDHGWGGLMLLLGGGVRGGTVYGRWPGIAADRLADGALAVTTDHRSVLSEVLHRRCSLPSTARVFPGFQPQELDLVEPR